MLILCLLSTLFPSLLYSQNDIPSNGKPIVEMYFVPSCTSKNNVSSTTVKGFYIAKHKVTRRLWNEIMGTQTDREADDYLPVTNVSRDEVQLFIFWLNQKTKMQYRLPTESEWTCAVRSGILPDVTPSFYLGGNDASTGFRLAMDYEGDDHNIDLDLTQGRGDTTKMEGNTPPPSQTTAADTAKASLQELLAAERQERATRRKAYIDAFPHTIFFTLNAQYTAMPQWSFGFKVGTVKFFGWYLGAMTNFNYLGAFSSFSPNGHYVLSGASKTTCLEGQLGFVVRPHNLVSVHLGAGYCYRTLNFESDQGWHYFPKRTFHGPTASLGVMFHVKGVALSAEACGMVYNLNPINDVRCAWGVRMGVGFFAP